MLLGNPALHYSMSCSVLHLLLLFIVSSPPLLSDSPRARRSSGDRRHHRRFYLCRRASRQATPPWRMPISPILSPPCLH